MLGRILGHALDALDVRLRLVKAVSDHRAARDRGGRCQQLNGGDPFALDSYDLKRQREVLRDRPDIAKGLLSRRGRS